MDESFTTYVRNCFDKNRSFDFTIFEDAFSEHYIKTIKELAAVLPEHAWDTLRAVLATTKMYNARLGDQLLASLQQNPETSGALSCALCGKTVYKNKIVKGTEFFVLASSTFGGDKDVTRSDLVFLCCSTHAQLVKHVYGIAHCCVDLKEYIEESSASNGGGTKGGEEAGEWAKVVAPRHQTIPVSQWKKTRASPPLTPFECEIIRYWNCVKLWTEPPPPPSARPEATQESPAEQEEK